MRVIVFFDLPTTTPQEVKNYTKFRKFLLKEGFIRMQNSVYTKLAINSTVSNLVKNKLQKNAPPDGLVQILTVTEKQFANINTIIGDVKSNVINNTDRVVFL